MGYKGRDAEVVFINEKQCLVITCDSCGAIGSKDLDLVTVPPYITGRFTCRVALAELLSVGAALQALSVTICNEGQPTGEEILRGVYDELNILGGKAIPIVISTEKNIPTRQTAVGITAVGICGREQLRAAVSQPGDRVYCLGVPKVGNELQFFDDNQIMQLQHILLLREQEGIHDILPVGSRGILAEADDLAQSVGCTFLSLPDTKVDLRKSAGPSTTLIFTCSRDTTLPSFPTGLCEHIGTLCADSP